MVLTIYSDSGYLLEPHSRRRVAGYFQLNSNNKSSKIVNGAILIEFKTLHHVVASSAESETSVIFHNAQVAMTVISMITQVVHPQPATRIKTDNTAADVLFHDSITQKKSKS